MDRAVDRILAGRTDPVPLGQVSLRLREREPVEIYVDAMGAVAAAVRRIREGN